MYVPVRGRHSGGPRPAGQSRTRASLDPSDAPYPVEVAIERDDVSDPSATHERDAHAVRDGEPSVVLELQDHRLIQESLLHEGDVCGVDEVLVEDLRRLPASAATDERDGPRDDQGGYEKLPPDAPSDAFCGG